MRHVARTLVVVGSLVSGAVLGGCAAAPRERPVKMGPVDTGAGSLEATRRGLEGSWTLSSLEVVDAAGVRRPVTANGRLTYDAYGNMMIRGVVEDAKLKDTLVIDFTGRIVIDSTKKQFYPADLNTDRPPSPSAIAAVSPDKVRQYDLAGDTFTVTYLDAAGKPTAVATWKRARV